MTTKAVLIPLLAVLSASVLIGQNLPLVRLAVQPAAPGRVRIAWSKAPANAVLEQASSLRPPVNWQLVPQAPVVQGGETSVQVEAGATERYFRLRTAGATQNLAGLAESSPANGEGNVAVTRETIFRFSSPLAAETVINTGQFYAEFGGRRLLARVDLSSDRLKASLFYLEHLPGNARVRVTLQGTGLADATGQPLDLNGDGVAGGDAVVEFDTASLTPVAKTAVIGRVFASELAEGPGTSVNKPLKGVTVTVDGQEETLRAVTDQQGNFKLEPAPAGTFFVHIDGRTSPESLWPDGAYYPFVGKSWTATAGRADNRAGGTGEIYLPLITSGTLQATSANADTKITFPAAVLAKNPELAGVEINVPANSLFSDNGTRGGKVGIAPVPADRLPGPLPPGVEMPIVITVQTDGGSNFDRPAPVCFPNLAQPGTNQPLPPGTHQALLSFNHDTGEWEAVGSMTVSADGKLVCTDPGSGILQPGWHGFVDPPILPPPCKECCFAPPPPPPPPGPSPLALTSSDSPGLHNLNSVNQNDRNDQVGKDVSPNPGGGGTGGACAEDPCKKYDPNRAGRP